MLNQLASSSGHSFLQQLFNVCIKLTELPTRGATITFAKGKRGQNKFFQVLGGSFNGIIPPSPVSK